jgi:hypothetical protein
MLNFVIHNAIMICVLNDVMLIADNLSVVMRNVVMPSVIILNALVLSAIMPSVLTLSVVILNVVAPKNSLNFCHFLPASTNGHP